MQLQLAQIVEALGPFSALDAALTGPFVARASSTVATKKGMPLYELSGATATILVEGPLARKADFFWGELWIDGYDRIVQAVESAAKDPDVESILFRFDTPGGQAQGVGDAAREMRAALDASGKPSIASVALAASAGYWLASIADEMHVDPDGAAGSIGTYTSHYDISRALDKAGVTITHIQDPEGKTSGTWTKPLDDEARARLQEVVSALSQSFYEHVGARRGMTPAAVRDLNARVFYGQKAVEAKLADGVLSYSSAKKRAGEMAQKRKKQQMSELTSFLGLPTSASAEDINKAAAEAKPLLELGRKAHALTGEKSADASAGVLAAWKQDAADAATLRAAAAQSAANADAQKRHDLLVKLAQVQAPALVWKEPGNPSAGPVQEYADMSTASLEAYVSRRANGSLPEALRTSVAANGAEPTDEEVKAHMRRENIKNEGIARADLRRQRGLQ